MTDRLPAHVEAAAIMRRIESEGGFATLIQRGDPDRGTITLLVSQRGQIAAVLERQLGPGFAYRWANVSAGRPFDQAAWRDFLAAKRKFDPDFWAIELDIADAERFVAETTSNP